VPIGVVVQHRQPPRQEGDRYIVPVYEEQLVVDKRLVLRAEMRIRVGPSAAAESQPVESGSMAHGPGANNPQPSPPPQVSPDQPTMPAKHFGAGRFMQRRTGADEAGEMDEPRSSGLQRWLLRFLS
jgi:hypothetical protein